MTTPVPSGPPPTKEIFVPVTSASDMYRIGDHPGAHIDAITEVAAIEMRIPWDFHNIVAIEIIFVNPVAATDMTAIISTDYGQVGENFDQHTEYATHVVIISGYSPASRLHAYSIASFVDSGPLAAGDHLGVRLEWDSQAQTTDIYLLGLRLRYT